MPQTKPSANATVKIIGAYFITTPPIAFIIIWAFSEKDHSFRIALERIPADLGAFVALLDAGLWTILIIPGVLAVDRILPKGSSTLRRRFIAALSASVIAAATTAFFGSWMAITPIGLALILGSAVFGALFGVRTKPPAASSQANGLDETAG